MRRPALILVQALAYALLPCTWSDQADPAAAGVAPGYYMAYINSTLEADAQRLLQSRDMKVPPSMRKMHEQNARSQAFMSKVKEGRPDIERLKARLAKDRRHQTPRRIEEELFAGLRGADPCEIMRVYNPREVGLEGVMRAVPMERRRWEPSGSMLAAAIADIDDTEPPLLQRFQAENERKAEAFRAGLPGREAADDVRVELLSVRAEEGARGALIGRAAERATERMRRLGVLALPGLVPRRLARAAAREAVAATEQERAKGGWTSAVNRLRFNVHMRMDPARSPSFEVLEAAVRAAAPVLRALVGEGGVLCEFGAISAYPGAAEQRLHVDAQPGRAHTGRLYSAFVHLEDVAPDMGPLEVFPMSAGAVHYFLHEYDPATMTVVEPGVRLALPMGSVFIYDASLRHRGTNNTSSRKRPSLLFSFRTNVPGEDLPEGPTYTMQDQYDPRYVSDPITLGDFLHNRRELVTKIERLNQPSAATLASIAQLKKQYKGTARTADAESWGSGSINVEDDDDDAPDPLEFI